MAAMDFSNITIAGFLRATNKGSAKRCLFGPVDHEANARLLKEQLDKQERESRAKWNFDFRTETPVHGGKYKWEKIESGNEENAVPVAYALPQISAPVKSRPCTPLSFSSRINLNSKDNVRVAKKNLTNLFEEKDNVVVAKEDSCFSPSEDRPVATTVPQLRKIEGRDETPCAQDLSTSATCSLRNVSENTTTTTSSSQREESSPSSRKRKLAQSDITAFFPVKKSRNLMAVNSAKRRLDL